MIMLKNNAALVVGLDGRSSPFEPEELQTRIIKSCLSSGNKDVWIAQDISLSVEYALSEKAEEGQATVRAAELDALVAKILEETGYGDVAESFRRAVPKEDSLMDVSSASPPLLDMLARRLSLSGKELSAVGASLEKAFKALGIGECNPQLALELARHFKDSLGEGSQILAAPGIKPVAGSGQGVFLAQAEELLCALDGELSALASSGSLVPRPLSRLFPVLALDLRLEPFAKLNGFAKPLNELALAPRLSLLSSGVDALRAQAERLCLAAGRSDSLPLPLWARMADASRFCKEWLGCSEEGAATAASELAAAIFSPLPRPPFKTTFI